MYIEKAVCQTLNKIVQLSLLFNLVGYTVVGRCLEAGNQNSSMIANLKNHSYSRGFYFRFCFHFHVGKQKKTKELIKIIIIQYYSLQTKTIIIQVSIHFILCINGLCCNRQLVRNEIRYFETKGRVVIGR